MQGSVGQRSESVVYHKLILDVYDNVASFEWDVVVYLYAGVSDGAGSCMHYNTMSRARTKLVVVDFDCNQRPPLITDEVVMTLWEERRGVFHRL